jgi:hypothetical protein
MLKLRYPATMNHSTDYIFRKSPKLGLWAGREEVQDLVVALRFFEHRTKNLCLQNWSGEITKDIRVFSHMHTLTHLMYLFWTSDLYQTRWHIPGTRTKCSLPLVPYTAVKETRKVLINFAMSSIVKVKGSIESRDCFSLPVLEWGRQECSEMYCWHQRMSASVSRK